MGVTQNELVVKCPLCGWKPLSWRQYKHDPVQQLANHLFENHRKSELRTLAQQLSSRHVPLGYKEDYVVALLKAMGYVNPPKPYEYLRER